MPKPKLSVTLATYNEEENIGRCLESVKELADEIVIVDGKSSDDTVKIAKSYGAKILITDNQKIFHINKNKANALATGDWILQLDADEQVSQALATEIRQTIKNNNSDLNQDKTPKLFLKHQRLIEKRDGPIGSQNPNDPIVAYFIPRKNLFLNKFMKYGGSYPDGVIRLFKKGTAKFGETSVHDQYKINGRVGWLKNSLKHYDSPTFSKYLQRNNRYSTLFALELADQKIPINLTNHIYYLYIKPLIICLKLYFRHKGWLEGFPGLIWAMYSGKTWSDAWIKYWETQTKT